MWSLCISVKCTPYHWESDQFVAQRYLLLKVQLDFFQAFLPKSKELSWGLKEIESNMIRKALELKSTDGEIGWWWIKDWQNFSKCWYGRWHWWLTSLLSNLGPKKSWWTLKCCSCVGSLAAVQQSYPSCKQRLQALRLEGSTEKNEIEPLASPSITALGTSPLLFRCLCCLCSLLPRTVSSSFQSIPWVPKPESQVLCNICLPPCSSTAIKGHWTLDQPVGLNLRKLCWPNSVGIAPCLERHTGLACCCSETLGASRGKAEMPLYTEGKERFKKEANDSRLVGVRLNKQVNLHKARFVQLKDK